MLVILDHYKLFSFCLYVYSQFGILQQIVQTLFKQGNSGKSLKCGTNNYEIFAIIG
jgi:hypothetical protein